MASRVVNRSPAPGVEGFARRVAPVYRPDIQGLRAVAVVLVVAGHVFGSPTGGYVGVDVFFVVSGFLITGLLLREHQRSGRLDLREFYARRVRRLLPAGVLVLSVTNVAAWLLFTGERAGQTLTDAGWALLFAANLRFAALGTDYFDQARPASPVQHYWSLAVEEQFYLVWPCLLIAVLVLARRSPRRHGRDPVRVALLIVLGLSVASLLWSVVSTRTGATAAYFSTPARAYELGLGALLALALATRVMLPVGRRAGTALTWTGLAGIAVAAWAFDSTTAFPGAVALLPVTAAALVLLGGTGPSRNVLLDNPLSTYVGGLSYSLYLWHWPVLVLAGAVLPGGAARTVTILSASFGLSMLCHHWVEEPVRASGWLSRRAANERARVAGPELPATLATPRLSRPVVAHTRRRRPARSLVAVGTVTGLLLGGWMLPALALRSEPVETTAAARAPDPRESAAGLAATIQASVAPASFPSLDVPLSAISRAGAPEWIVDGCDNVNSGNVTTCRYGDPAAPRTAALVGDSMAISWLPGLRAALEPRGWHIAVLTRNQCPLPRIGLWRDRPSEPFTACADHKDWVVDQLRRLQPDLVIASNAITFLDHEQGEPRGDARFGPWQRGMTQMLSQLKAVAGRVVLLGPPPRAGNLQSCLTRLSKPVDCTSSVTADWRGLRRAERTAAEAAGADYVDVEPLFCAAGRCPAVVGSTPVYTDGRHLTAAYSRRLAPRLGELLGLARPT